MFTALDDFEAKDYQRQSQWRNTYHQTIGFELLDWSECFPSKNLEPQDVHPVRYLLNLETNNIIDGSHNEYYKGSFLTKHLHFFLT